MIITKHGYKRIKERVGLPKRAHKRHIGQVMKDGWVSSYKGLEEFIMVYHGFLYIFKLSQDFEAILVTTHRATKYNLIG